MLNFPVDGRLSPWQKLLLATPFLGIVPSYLFDTALKAEVLKAHSSQKFQRAVNLLVARSQSLKIGGTRDLLSSMLLVSLLATDRIAKPPFRMLAILSSLYFAASSLQKDGLIDYHRRILPRIREGNLPPLP